MTLQGVGEEPEDDDETEDELEQENEVSKYNRDELLTMTVINLRNIARINNILLKGNKETLINRIIANI